MMADVIVETAQNVFAAINQRHMRAEPGEDSGELDRDIAAALDYDTAWKVRQMERLIRRDDMLDAGNRIAVARRGAGGDQDVARTRPRAIGQLNGVSIEECGPGFDDLDARFRQSGAVSG